MPKVAAPDAELVRRAQRGDRPAFEELVRKTTHLVYAHLYLETADPHVAEDLVQETYLNAFRCLRRLQKPQLFRSWLLTIAHNACVSAHRRKTRKKRAGTRLSGLDPDQLHKPGEEPPDLAEREERRRRVLSIIRSMPENYRLALMMRFLLGADYETMSAQLGLSNGALRGILNRGVRLLQQKLKGG